MIKTNDALIRYLDALPPSRRSDAELLITLLSRVTGEPAALHGTVIGFGTYHYKYASGREGDAPAAAFAMRRAAITIYFMDGVGAHREALERLGSHTAGVGCIYVKRLADIDLATLESMVASSYRTLTAGAYGQRAQESSDRLES